MHTLALYNSQLIDDQEVEKEAPLAEFDAGFC